MAGRAGDLMQMASYTRVCISSAIMRDEYILWAFCGDKLLCAVVSIKCASSTIQSFCVHNFPLLMAFLMCFPHDFLYGWYPLPIFQRAQPA